MLTTTKLNAFKTAFFYSLDPTKLDSNGVNSSVIELNESKWKVQFRKKTNENCANAHALAVHLIGTFNKDETKWTCEAQAVVKLLHKDRCDDRTVSKELPKRTFDSSNSIHGIDDFIKWDDFLQHHVLDNVATFEIEICTSPLKRKRPDAGDVNPFATAFHIVIENVSKLDSVFSPTVILQDVRWKLQTSKKGEYLAVHLYGEYSDMDPNWSFEVDTTIQLLSLDGKEGSYTIKIKETFNSCFNGWGRPAVLKWADFVDPTKNYVRKDQASLLVELKVTKLKPMWNIQCQSRKAANMCIECCVCFDRFPSGQIFSLKCGHLFCKPCFDKSITQRKVCPTCNLTTTVNQIHPIFFG